MRCDEPGWTLIALADGRRGIWTRDTGSGDKRVIEVCAGREGDDEYVRLAVGEQVTEQHLFQLEGIFSAFSWATEIAGDEEYRLPLGDRREIATVLRNLARTLADGPGIVHRYKQKIGLKTEPCTACAGSGVTDGGDDYCHCCKGTGELSSDES